VRFRSRILLAMGGLALGPLIGVAIGVRHEMERRLAAQYQSQATALADVTRETLTHESATIAERLASLREAMVDDNRLRLAVTQRDPAQRSYLLDYAQTAARLTGLAMLQIQDGEGRILSSGHFRNEFDRLEPDLPDLLRAAPGAAAIVDARTPDGPMRVIARADSVRLGGRQLALVGGVRLDDRFLRTLTPDSAFQVILDGDPDGAAPSIAPPGRRIVAVVPVPFVGGPPPGAADTSRRQLRSARFVITHSDAGLAELARGVDRWFIGVFALATLAVLIGAIWLAAQVSGPLRALAGHASTIDLDRLDVGFASDRRDEVGELSRLLDAMARRLRASARRLREAEHRATVGDLARQVTHDIKNGLVPIRHVLRHLAQVEREEPARLAGVLAERRPTLDASVDYLDTLARRYARLRHTVEPRPCDLNAIVREAAARAATDDRVPVAVRTDPCAPRILADPLILHRVLDNLLTNAADAAAETGGRVTIGTRGIGASGAGILVTDTGPGMTDAELARAFEDFHTTKAHGTGLGLSIVRRLASDLDATLRVDTAPGRGTSVEIEWSDSSHQPLLATAR